MYPVSMKLLSTLLIALFACLAATSSQAADLIWEVESPFRFFKASRSFALHEAAFNAARSRTWAWTSIPA